MFLFEILAAAGDGHTHSLAVSDASLSQHLTLILGAAIVVGAVAVAIVWRQYNKIIDRLEKLDHPRDGYVRQDACREMRADCGGGNAKCQEKVMLILERLERKVERNAGMMFYLADILVEKEIISGKDLTGLRERLMKGMATDE